MSTNDGLDVAARLSAAAVGRSAITKLTDEFPGLDIAAGYRVQRELQSAAGAVTGWRLGLTSRANRPRWA